MSDRKMSVIGRMFPIFVLSLMVRTGSSSGCAVCFGNQESSLTQGMNMGILTLLGFILPLLFGMAFFIGYLAWRNSHPISMEETISSAGAEG